MDRKPIGKRVRDAIGRLFLKEELESLKDAQRLMMEAYEWGPAYLTPERLESLLREVVYDPETFDFTFDLLNNWDIISGKTTSEESRLRLVNRARKDYRLDVGVGHLIDLWTDFGFGLNVDVVPRDDIAKEVWDNFWQARRNKNIFGQRKLQGLSRQLLNDGEFFMVFFVSRVDGETTVRIIPTDEITEIVTLTDDAQTAAFYLREYTPKGSTESKKIYIRDWLAEENKIIDESFEILDAPNGEVTITGQKKKVVDLKDDIKIAHKENDKTDVFILHVAWKPSQDSLRGWPLLASGLSWADVYTGFLQDRAAVAKTVAMFVDKITAKSGQRGLDALKAKMQSSLTQTGNIGYERNPAPTRGSVWLENEAATRERMPLGTGGGDAMKDGAMLIGQMSMAGRIFPHWMGYGDAYRLATATAMELPILKAFEGYQTFWASVWTDISFAVFREHNRYSPSKEIKDVEVDVNQDSIIDVEMTEITTVMDKTLELYEQGQLTDEQTEAIVMQLMRVALQYVGIRNIDSLFEPAEDEENPTEESEEPTTFVELIDKITKIAENEKI